MDAQKTLGWLPYRLGRYTESAQYFKRLSRAGKGEITMLIIGGLRVYINLVMKRKPLVFIIN